MTVYQRLVLRAFTVIGAATALGVITGAAMTPPQQVAASCEGDECDEGIFWDSCEQSSAQTSCNMVDDDNCETKPCAVT